MISINSQYFEFKILILLSIFKIKKLKIETLNWTFKKLNENMNELGEKLIIKKEKESFIHRIESSKLQK